jgi:TolB protein
LLLYFVVMNSRFFRKLICSAFVAFACGSLDISSVGAQTTVVISDPIRKSPIALPVLCLQGADSLAPKEVPRTIAKDLDLSGFFDVLDPSSYIEAPGKCVPPDAQVYGDWTVIRTEWLVRGTVEGSGGNITLRLFLHDVPGQRAVLGKGYSGNVSDARKMAHKFANEVMKYVTGSPGPFGSEVVFSSRVGRFKDLFLMEMDGSNIRQLTNERGLALSPSFDREGKQILFTSYRQRVPDLFLLTMGGKARQITRSPTLEVGGTFTPNGNQVLTSISEGQGSTLVLLNLDGTVARRVTPSDQSIDVSPSYSPDGSQLVYCSDRSGGPQVYTSSSDGSGSKRISFVRSNYCTSPRWSPKGDKIVFVCRVDGGFQMFLSDPEGGSAIQLTSDGDNEDPTWSPDGRYLMFSSSFGKRAGVKSLALIRVVKGAEGSNLKQLTFGRADDLQPSWGPVPE